MAQVNNQANIRVNPNSIRGTIQDTAPERETPPVRQKVGNNIQQEDRVDVGKPKLTRRNVIEETKRVDVVHEKQVKKENPPIPSPPQNTANINLSTRQEPETERAPKVDRHSIRTTIQEGASRRREPNVVEQQIVAARSAGARPKPNPGQTEARQNEATARVQVRQEQKQNTNETELRRSPAAVQTQKGQNVDKLT